jgi:hypothetical protein
MLRLPHAEAGGGVAVPLEYWAEVANCAAGVCRVNFAP